MRIGLRVLAATAATLALATGCGVTGAVKAQPTWVDKPDPPPAEANPELPGPPAGGAPQPGPRGPRRPRTPSNGDSGILATKLAAPWGLAMLPDGSAIVGERTTGRILRVQPQAGRKVQQVMRVGGIDPSGDGGLLGLALSPSYLEDRLVFAYVTTPTDNRVVKFELGGQPAPVLTGIPRGHAGNGGRIAFGPDGNLYVGTGDVGNPTTAADRATLAGKVLRVTPFGRPAPGNPFGAASAVYATGFHDVTGLCFDTRKHLFAVDAGSGRGDEVDVVVSGANYGWPTVVGKAGKPGLTDAVDTIAPSEAGLGGCGSVGFGLFVSALDGTRLWAFPLDGTGRPTGKHVPLVQGRYGRLRTVVPAADGALWVTTSNRDGHGKPVADDERVIRIVPPPETTNSPV